uniref:Uncharacterized protein n=1 Tax=Anguilla anguilla TaxID=7936 RepID=A0A0E9RX19_ANGAN
MFPSNLHYVKWQ